jgi:hypothetical protein
MASTNENDLNSYRSEPQGEPVRLRINTRKLIGALLVTCLVLEIGNARVICTIESGMRMV